MSSLSSRTSPRSPSVRSIASALRPNRSASRATISRTRGDAVRYRASIALGVRPAAADGRPGARPDCAAGDLDRPAGDPIQGDRLGRQLDQHPEGGQERHYGEGSLHRDSVHGRSATESHHVTRSGCTHPTTRLRKVRPNRRRVGTSAEPLRISVTSPRGFPVFRPRPGTQMGHPARGFPNDHSNEEFGRAPESLVKIATRPGERPSIPPVDGPWTMPRIAPIPASRPSPAGMRACWLRAQRAWFRLAGPLQCAGGRRITGLPGRAGQAGRPGKPIR